MSNRLTSGGTGVSPVASANYVRRLKLVLLLAAMNALVMLPGCAGTSGRSASIPEITNAPESAPKAAKEESSKQQEIKLTSATEELDSQQEAMAAVLEELEEIGAVDPVAQQQLMEDLQKTKPSLWPLMVRQFKAALEYQRQLAERENAEPIGHSQPVSHVAPVAPPPEEPQTESMPDRAASPTAPATLPPSPALPDDHQSKAQPIDGLPRTTHVAYSSQSRMQIDHDWSSHVDSAIRLLQDQTAERPRSEDEIRKHIQLRLLYLTRGQREAAISPIPGLPPTQQDFWSQELFGLSTLLDENDTRDSSRRAADASRYFSEANLRLGELSTLSVKNLTFCREVNSYGVYKTFDKFEFRPGEQVLLYAEIENFRSEATEKGYHTKLRSSYEILDSRGQRVTQHDFSTTEEYCQNHRRDFFMRYFVNIPKRIYPGTYRLQLTVEDIKSQKIGQAAAEFKVLEGES